MRFAKTVLLMLGLLLSQNALADDGLSEHSLDSNLDGARPDDDHPRALTFVWRVSPGQKHSVRTNAVFCDHLHGVIVVGDHRLFLSILGGWSTAWRV